MNSYTKGVLTQQMCMLDYCWVVFNVTNVLWFMHGSAKQVSQNSHRHTRLSDGKYVLLIYEIIKKLIECFTEVICNFQRKAIFNHCMQNVQMQNKQLHVQCSRIHCLCRANAFKGIVHPKIQWKIKLLSRSIIKLTMNHWWTILTISLYLPVQGQKVLGFH